MQHKTQAVLDRARSLMERGLAEGAPADAFKIIEEHAVRYAKALAGLADASKRRRRTYTVLRSFSGRVCTLVRAWPPATPVPGWDDFLKMAEGLDARKDCGEPIRAWFKRKANGDHRPICDFGPRRRALQRLAADVLEACDGASPFEYARKGRGRDTALRRVMEFPKIKGGPRWYLTADVKSCFASFDKAGVKSMMRLPKAVMDITVFIPDTAIITLGNIPQGTSEGEVRKGFPQGSLCSPIFVSKLLQPVLENLAGKIVIGHADDILVGTTTEVEAVANKQALEKLLQQHPAGPLLMTSRVAKIGKPIDFLGYRVRQRWLAYGGGIRLTPSPKAFAKFTATAFERARAAASNAMEAAVDAYEVHWRAGHQLWDWSEGADGIMAATKGDILVFASQAKAGKLKVPTGDFKLNFGATKGNV